MTLSEIIQTIISIVLLMTFVAIWRSMHLQNRLLGAQLLRDLFERYRWTFGRISDDEVREFELYPNDYLAGAKYENHFRGNHERIRRYIRMVQVYHYLAFAHELKRLKYPNPIGFDWIELWVKELEDETEFANVHESYRAYYPDFATYIGETRKST